MAASIFEGVIFTGTAKAFLFQGNYWEAPLWIPRSQSTVEPDEENWVITLTKWYTGIKGLEEFRHYSKEAMEAMDSR